MRNKYSNNDFKEEYLPSNRLEQFSDIFKIQLRTLFGLGVLFLLFLLPLSISIVFKNNYVISLEKTLESQGVSINEQAIYIFIVNLVYIAILFITLLIFILGLSGIMRILRNLVWNEGVIFKSDFIDGIKANFVSFLKILLLTFIIVIINVISNFFISFYLKSPANIITTIIIDFIDVFIFLPLLAYFISVNTVYVSTIKKTIVNSFVLLLKSYLKNLPFLLIPIGYLFIFYIPNLIIMIIVYVIFTLIVLPISVLGWYLLHISIFDKYVNQQYEEYHYKGLYKNDK